MPDIAIKFSMIREIYRIDDNVDVLSYMMPIFRYHSELSFDDFVDELNEYCGELGLVVPYE